MFMANRPLQRRKIVQVMRTHGVNKSNLALRMKTSGMKTSRAQLNRLLDDADTGLTLETLRRAA